MATFSRRATIEWSGDVPRGTGGVTAGSGAFSIPVTFPRLGGEPAGTSSPEELLAASHATCFGIGLRSQIGMRGGTARRVEVTATVTADKGSREIRIRSSHLTGHVEGLEGVDPTMLPEIAQAVEEGCTISAAIRQAVAISVEISAV